MLGFNSFRAPAEVLAGIELLHMIGKGQRHFLGSVTSSFTDQITHGQDKSVLHKDGGTTDGANSCSRS